MGNPDMDKSVVLELYMGAIFLYQLVLALEFGSVGILVRI